MYGANWQHINWKLTGLHWGVVLTILNTGAETSINQSSIKQSKYTCNVPLVYCYLLQYRLRPLAYADNNESINQSINYPKISQCQAYTEPAVSQNVIKMSIIIIFINSFEHVNGQWPMMANKISLLVANTITKWPENLLAVSLSTLSINIYE